MSAGKGRDEGRKSAVKVREKDPVKTLLCIVKVKQANAQKTCIAHLSRHTHKNRANPEPPANKQELYRSSLCN